MHWPSSLPPVLLFLPLSQCWPGRKRSHSITWLPRTPAHPHPAAGSLPRQFLHLLPFQMPMSLNFFPEASLETCEKGRYGQTTCYLIISPYRASASSSTKWETNVDQAQKGDGIEDDSQTGNPPTKVRLMLNKGWLLLLPVGSLHSSGCAQDHGVLRGCWIAAPQQPLP